MIILISLVLLVLMLSFANGANDNFKGVATLLGSGTTNYRKALWWATVCTFLGSLTAAFLAIELLKKFSGKGLVPDVVVNDPSFAASVACAAGMTVLLATRFGLPVSTTHGLIGALVGAGLASGSTVQLSQMNKAFVIPLLTSPLLSLLASVVIYPLLSFTRKQMGVVSDSCLCVDAVASMPVVQTSGVMSVTGSSNVVVHAGNNNTCSNTYSGRILGIQAQSVLDKLHFISGGIVSFARGLNDTPKIAAIMLVGLNAIAIVPILLVGVFMAAGGILRGKKVAETMGLNITKMNHGQGFTANVIAGIIIISASWMGMPVSTTHVTCGSLFGIGLVNGQGKWQTIFGIAGAWLVTLPLGMLLGAGSFWIISHWKN